MGLLAHMFEFVEGHDDEVRAWLDDSYVASIIKLPRVVGAAGYEAVTGTPRFLNLVEAESIHAFYTEEFLSWKSNPSEGARKMKGLLTEEVRLVCSQIYPSLSIPKHNSPTVDVAGLAPVVQFGRIFVPEDKIEDFNGWYAQDRGPLCEQVPGVRRIRRYAPVEGDSVMIVLYEMDDESVRETPEWKEMNASEWTARVRSYYKQASGSPGVYRRRGDARLIHR